MLRTEFARGKTAGQIASGLSNPGYEHLEMVYGTFYCLAWPELRDDVSSFLKSEDVREKKIWGENYKYEP